MPAVFAGLSRSKTMRLPLLMVPVLLLAACSSMILPTKQVALAPTFSEGSSRASVDNSQTKWWLAFRDDRLDRFINAGLAENLSVMQAVERLNEVGAGLTTASAGALPNATGNVVSTTTQTGEQPAEATSSATLNASWLLDLFGQHRLSREAAEANLDAAYFSVEAARLTFLSGLTNAYIDLRYNQEALALTRASLSTRRETLELTEALLAEGAGSRLDVLQARGALDAASAEIPGLELGFITALNRLAALTTQPSNNLRADLQRGAPQPWPRLRTNVGVPADLVRQRPDVKAAERSLTAAVLEAGAAEAALYPSLTLGGNIQLGATGSWSFGPTFNLPFLDGGRGRANLQAAQSRAQQAYLAWQSAIINAVEETENALAAVRRSGQTIDAAKAVAATAGETLELARENYRAGGGRVLDVLDAQRTHLDARMRLALATQQLAKNYVALNVALGGGASVLSAAR